MTGPGHFPLLPRKKNTDKKNYGHTLVLAGSPSTRGAAILTAQGALVSGSGLVTLGTPKSLQSYFSKKALAETMFLGLPETKNQTLSLAAFDPIQQFIQKRRVTCIALGPGLSREPQTMVLVRKLVNRLSCPIVLDADGLNSFEKKTKELKAHAGSLVLTPHAGEFKRLFGKCEVTKKLSKLYDFVLVLKGHRTRVIERNNIYVNKTGNPGMAKGGSGDVLTGMIAAFISQGLAPFEAAKFGVYYHGLAGDLAEKEKGELSLSASDLIDYLPKIWAG